jgi:hypothetical protein
METVADKPRRKRRETVNKPDPIDAELRSVAETITREILTYDNRAEDFPRFMFEQILLALGYVHDLATERAMTSCWRKSRVLSPCHRN